jgi:hypothetical protein
VRMRATLAPQLTPRTFASPCSEVASSPHDVGVVEPTWVPGVEAGKARKSGSLKPRGGLEDADSHGGGRRGGRSRSGERPHDFSPCPGPNWTKGTKAG